MSETSHSAVLEIKDLRKTYGAQVALNGISFSVQRGELVTLVGANGAGKSTLMKLLMRQEAPASGDATVLGHSINDDNDGFNAKVGFVSEAVEFHLRMPMAEIAKLYAKLYSEWDQSLFLALKEQFKLDLAKNYHEISRGQQMHFVFTLALSTRPEVLLLDEVTAVMDPWARMIVMTRLKEFVSRGGTVLLATNILNEIQHFAHRILVIAEGTVRLDIGVRELNEKFLKIRLDPSLNPESFASLGEYRETATNTDGTISYLAPKEHAVQIAGALPDKRSVSAEDLFIYFTRKGA